MSEEVLIRITGTSVPLANLEHFVDDMVKLGVKVTSAIYRDVPSLPERHRVPTEVCPTCRGHGWVLAANAE